MKIHRQRTHLGILFLLLLVGTPAAAETTVDTLAPLSDDHLVSLPAVAV